jgi:glycosyltransferase involved in cell wall biosynthesis
MPKPSPESEPLLLSIVIPVYNGQAYIQDCLDSVAAGLLDLSVADRAAVEVIVSDNHSTDRTRELVRQQPLTGSCRVVQPPRHFENRTQNWHYGLSQTQAPWMMMLHADDLLAPRGFAAVLRACRARLNGPAALIWGRHRTFKDRTRPGRLRPSWPFRSLVNGAALRRTVLPFHCCFLPFMIMRRAAYQTVGGLDERFQLVQDWDLWIRLTRLGPVYYEPAEFCWWREHAVSPWYRSRMAEENLVLAGRFERMIPDLSPPARRRALAVNYARAVSWLSEPARIDEVLTSLGGELGETSFPVLSSGGVRTVLRGTTGSVRHGLLRLLTAGSVRYLLGRSRI